LISTPETEDTEAVVDRIRYPGGIEKSPNTLILVGLSHHIQSGEIDTTETLTLEASAPSKNWEIRAPRDTNVENVAVFKQRIESS
jgi:hypothetical protein